jgi:hypothetical protein
VMTQGTNVSVHPVARAHFHADARALPSSLPDEGLAWHNPACPAFVRRRELAKTLGTAHNPEFASTPVAAWLGEVVAWCSVRVDSGVRPPAGVSAGWIAFFVVARSNAETPLGAGGGAAHGLRAGVVDIG